MSAGERIFRLCYLLLLLAVVGFSLYSNRALMAAFFGFLLGSALERLIHPRR